MKSKEPKYRATYWKKWRKVNRPYKKKYCQLCHKEFVATSNVQKRCANCRYLICLNCGKNFIPANSTIKGKYCSKKCAYAVRKGIEPEHLKSHRGIKPRTYHKRGLRGGVFEIEWRNAVYKRDKYVCQGCGKRGGKLNAHHIKPYKKYPELRYNLKNGITLCIDCHKKTDSYGWANYWKNHKRLGQEVLF